MAQHHQMDITVTGKGELDIKMHYRDQVPDLMSRFSDEVQRRARRLFWIRSPYERKLWKAARLMPPWARETIRQHILHERAVLIDARLRRLQEQQRQRQLQREAQVTVRQERLPEAGVSGPSAGLPAKTAITSDRHRASTSLRAPNSRALTLTELLALERATPLADAHPALDRSRGR